MHPRMFWQSKPCNSAALEIKRIMAESIERAKVLYGTSKKQIAIDMGLPVEKNGGSPILSHYLSPNTGYTIPAHLVRPFCESTRDWTLSRALQKRRAA